MGQKITARELVRGDVFRLRDGRIVQVMTDPPRNPRRTFTLSLWEVDTNTPNFGFTVSADAEYEIVDY
jgi:hypothetical protein